MSLIPSFLGFLRGYGRNNIKGESKIEQMFCSDDEKNDKKVIRLAETNMSKNSSPNMWDRFKNEKANDILTSNSSKLFWVFYLFKTCCFA